jgi:hypothetical protein
MSFLLRRWRAALTFHFPNRAISALAKRAKIRRVAERFRFVPETSIGLFIYYQPIPLQIVRMMFIDPNRQGWGVKYVSDSDSF